MDEVIGGHPVAEIGWQQRGVAVKVDETWAHADRIEAGVVLFKPFSKTGLRVSPTGC